MSRYGEDGSTGYAKEDLFDEINDFLERHTVAEFLKIVTDVIEMREETRMVKLDADV